VSERERLHRPDPVRTAPLRSFSNLYRRPDASNGRVTRDDRASAEQAGPVAGGGPLADGVELAYRVIERYVSEGRRTAEQFNSEPYSMRSATDGAQELLERMLRFQSEMLPMWLEAMRSMLGADTSPPSYTPGSRAKASTNGAAKEGSTAVSIELISARPVRVSLELREHSETMPLVSLGLRAVDPDRPMLTDISFVPEDNGDGRRLRIRIPDGQPPGVYSGVIVNRDTGEARGTLGVRLD
jgi:hypothetical protein